MSWKLLRATCAEDLESALDGVFERSAGVVTRCELFTSRPYRGALPRQLRPERGGPRCERIFGPVRDHRCCCSKYRGVEHAGIRCEKCGVEVIGTGARSTRWAHVELSPPVFHPAAAETVASRLGLSAREVCDVARFEAWLDDGQCRRPTEPVGAEYDGHLHPQILDHISCTGPRALQQALRDGHGSAHDTSPTFVRVLPVPPPGERPLRLHNREYFAGDVDLALSALLSTDETVKRLRELAAPAFVIAREQQTLQRRFERLLTTVTDGTPGWQGGDGTPNGTGRAVSSPDLEYAPDDAQDLWWLGETLLLRRAGTLVELSARGEAVRQTPCVAPGAKVVGISEDGGLVAFDQYGMRRCVIERATGAWLEAWPDELNSWLAHAAKGEGVATRCGAFTWVGDAVYSVADGSACANPGHWFDFDSIEVLERDGVRRRVDRSTFEELEEDVGYDTVERLELAQSTGRAIAQTGAGLVVFSDNVVARVDGPLLFVSFAYDAAAFSPDGSRLGLVDGESLLLVDLETLTLDEVRIGDADH